MWSKAARAILQVAGTIVVSDYVGAQSAPTPPEASRFGSVWVDVAAGLNSRGFAVIPGDVSAAGSVAIRLSPLAGPVSFRVGAIAKSSGSLSGQFAIVGAAMFSLPSRPLSRPGLSPYAVGGVGLYGLDGVAGGAHAGLGAQLGGRRHSLSIEWTRHSAFDVSQLTFGLGSRFR